MSKPAQEAWNTFITSPLFDEIFLHLQARAEDRTLTQTEVHLFAREAGYKEGYQACLQNMWMGFPEEIEDNNQPAHVYNTFSKPKENVSR